MLHLLHSDKINEGKKVILGIRGIINQEGISTIKKFTSDSGWNMTPGPEL
jgi:hypothetical protein